MRTKDHLNNRANQAYRIYGHEYVSCFYYHTHHVIFSVTVNDSLMNECLIENFINYFLRDWRRFPNHKGAIKICDLKKVTLECDYLCPMILIYFFKKRKRAYYARLLRI
jgi:hypothetical protein